MSLSRIEDENGAFRHASKSRVMDSIGRPLAGSFAFRPSANPDEAFTDAQPSTGIHSQVPQSVTTIRSMFFVSSQLLKCFCGRSSFQGQLEHARRFSSKIFNRLETPQ